MLRSLFVLALLPLALALPSTSPELEDRSPAPPGGSGGHSPAPPGGSGGHSPSPPGGSKDHSPAPPGGGGFELPFPGFGQKFTSSCGDHAKKAFCFSKGYGCTEQCECIPPTPQFCLDPRKYLPCIEKGIIPDKHCDCNPHSQPKPPQCSSWNKYVKEEECHYEGGWFDSQSCKCTLPTHKKHHHHARELGSPDHLCPGGLKACSLGDGASWKGAYECLNITSAVDSCGGCIGEGLGTDCTDIKGVEDVDCVSSQCVVTSCAPGFAVNIDSTGCVEDDSSVSRKLVIGSLKGAEKFWGL